MIVFVVLTIGLGILVTSLIHANWNSPGSERTRLTFDPIATSLVGTALAQFAVGVIGSLFITTEYTTGSIRTTLAATSACCRALPAWWNPIRRTCISCPAGPT